ncbi:DNA-binding protein [Salmonella sp. NCTC 11881]|nr:DNA-binding protein [Salmonella sp. NCTC 11881]
MTANQAYQQLAKLGVVEHRERYSRSAINGIKKFWSLTAKGCMFGKKHHQPGKPSRDAAAFLRVQIP